MMIEMLSLLVTSRARLETGDNYDHARFSDNRLESFPSQEHEYDLTFWILRRLGYNDLNFEVLLAHKVK